MRAGMITRRTVMAFATILVSIAGAQTPQENYTTLCAGCHGASFRLPGGGVTNGTLTQLAEAIRNGVPLRGMPAFGRQLVVERWAFRA